MPKLDQQGIAHLLLMILMLAGVGLGVYLVGQRTQLFPWAASNPVNPCPVSAPCPPASPSLVPSPSASSTPTPRPSNRPTAGTPLGLEVASNSCALGSPEVALVWNPVANVNGYNVYRKYDFQGQFYYIGTVSGSNNVGFVDTKESGVVGNSGGVYRIVSGDNNGQSDYSNEVKVITRNCANTTTPPAPQGLSLVSNSCEGKDGALRISWVGVPNVNGYNVYRRYDFQGPYNLIGTITGTQFVDKPATGIVENANGYYRVTSGNNSGESGVSSAIFVKSANCP